jgi:putative hydrolase of the HAD superfamily
LQTKIRPKAVIFDYGNVLCAPQTEADLEALAAVLKVAQAEFLPAYWRRRIEYDEAALTSQSYWQAVAAVAQRSIGDAEIERLVRIDSESWGRPDPVMVEWARKLREAGIRTAVLSNMPAAIRDFLTHSAGWMPRFDCLTFSCDLGVCKPDPAIYQQCLTKLGVGASEALFLDDRLENVEGAQRVGMHSFVFTNPAEASKTLEREFLLPVELKPA